MRGFGALQPSGVWRATLLLSVLLLTVADTVLLGAGTGFLTSGFNSAHIDGLALVLMFLPASMLLDGWLVLCIWLAAIPLARALTRSRAQQLTAAFLAGAGLPIAFAAANQNVYAVLGDMFSVNLSHQISGLGYPDLASESLREFPFTGMFAIACLVAGAGVLTAARRLEERDPETFAVSPPPSPARLVKAIAALSALDALLLGSAAATLSDLQFGFERKVSGQLFASLLDLATDLDHDHFGLLERPLDHEPFDASSHPYAIDVPGNGRDEDQIAGDLPLAAVQAGAAGAQIAPPPGDGGARPDFLLVYLESFQFDLLEARLRGREVTPFLRRLATEGSSAQHAYTHAPWTLASREQLFTGRLLAKPGDPTLVDDFAARGYRVAYFSGQDESYGDSERRLGAHRADRFYDARQDVARRTSRSTAPISLQVSWKTLLERLNDYLKAPRDDRPLFLYVNVVDTHFPYWHSEIDDLLGVAPLDRSEIRARSAARVREAYANTAANVDRAVEHVVAAFRAHIGGRAHAILVTADHGQALYDRGVLGHGQSLEAELTHTPFILWGVGGDWPEPIAPSDVRGLLLDRLSRREPGTLPRARFVADPARRVFEYVPGLEQPTVIGLQGIEDRLEYSFGRSRLERVDARGERSEIDVDANPRALQEVVWRWEIWNAASQTMERGAD